MKFRKFLLPILAATLIFTACNKADNEPEPTKTTEPNLPAIHVDFAGKDNSVQGTIDEYFPFVQGAHYVYERSDALGTSSTYNMYVEGNKMQRITDAGVHRVSEVLEYSNGELTVNYASDTISCYENFIDIVSGYPMVILKEPLQIGNTWETYSGATIKGVAKGLCAITDVNVEIETPHGKVTAIEVSTELENGYTNVDYYAKGIGLVKNGYFIKGFVTESTNESTANITRMEDVTTDALLKSFETGKDYEFTLNLYSPSENADELNITEFNYTFDPSVTKEQLFENLFKNLDGDENFRVISPNTKVNSIKIVRATSTDPDTNKSTETTTVYLDLSKDFSDDMNAGSGYELLLLESLSTTLKEFFRAGEFVLSIDGAPYVSNH